VEKSACRAARSHHEDEALAKALIQLLARRDGMIGSLPITRRADFLF
jgi:hypothetical protein